jgi:hypothetical protein
MAEAAVRIAAFLFFELGEGKRWAVWRGQKVGRREKTKKSGYGYVSTSSYNEIDSAELVLDTGY